MKLKLSDQAIRRIAQYHPDFEFGDEGEGLLNEDQAGDKGDNFNYALSQLGSLGPKGPYHIKIESEDGGSTKWMLVDSEKVPILIEWLSNVETE